MHFERGANYEQAVRHLHQAAENALRRFAYREAIGLARRGLGLIKKLPDTPERARQELGLYITLGVPMIATEGYAAPDVGRVYTRARELGRQFGGTPEISQSLWGLWTFYLVKAELGTAREIAEEYLRLAKSFPYAAASMGVTLMHLGEFTPALEHCMKAFSLYDPVRHRDGAFRYTNNAGVGAQSHAAWTLWFLGLPDQALHRVEQAMALARELTEPPGLAHTLFFAALLYQLRREETMAQKMAEAAIAVSGEHGLSLYQAMASVIQGWALIAKGRPDEAIKQIRMGLSAHERTGTVLLHPQFSAMLAEALGVAGRIDEGLRVMEEAIAESDSTGDRYYTAEMYRLKGEMLVMQAAKMGPGKAGSAEACFQRSITVARQQKAMAWELRATTSLARHYLRHSKPKKARTLLVEVHHKFTEGFTTRDWREAKALVDELS